MDGDDARALYEEIASHGDPEDFAWSKDSTHIGHDVTNGSFMKTYREERRHRRAEGSPADVARSSDCSPFSTHRSHKHTFTLEFPFTAYDYLPLLDRPNYFICPARNPCSSSPAYLAMLDRSQKDSSLADSRK